MCNLANLYTLCAKRLPKRPEKCSNPIQKKFSKKNEALVRDGKQVSNSNFLFNYGKKARVAETNLQIGLSGLARAIKRTHTSRQG